MNATEIRTRSCHIAARNSARAHILATMSNLFLVNSLFNNLRKVVQNVCSKGLILDVNVKTSQTSSKTSILALFTNSQRQLIIRNNNGCVTSCAINNNARNTCR